MPETVRPKGALVKVHELVAFLIGAELGLLVELSCVPVEQPLDGPRRGAVQRDRPGPEPALARLERS
jgi:hypothetical protein